MTDFDLHLGDCLELMKDIPDGSVDMILCDLPYYAIAEKRIQEASAKLEVAR